MKKSLVCLCVLMIVAAVAYAEEDLRVPRAGGSQSAAGPRGSRLAGKTSQMKNKEGQGAPETHKQKSSQVLHEFSATTSDEATTSAPSDTGGSGGGAGGHKTKKQANVK